MDSFSPKWVHLNGFPLWLDFKSVSCRKNSHFCFWVIYQSLTTPGPAIRISHIGSQPWHYVTKGSNYKQKGLLTPMYQRVLRVNSVFQSKNIITLPAHLKKWRVWNAHGWAGTFLGALRPWGQGNSDTSLHTPLRRDAWSLSAPQKARQAWLHAVFGSFSAERGETGWCKQKGWGFCWRCLCVWTPARFPWLMQESTDFSQYQSNVVMRGCVCARVGSSGCAEIWYVGIVGLFQAACGNNEWKRP